MNRPSPYCWLALLVAGLGSCSSDEEAGWSPRCGVVGQSVACACSDGRNGAQVCQEDGTLTGCSCTEADAGVGRAGGGPSSGAGPGSTENVSGESGTSAGGDDPGDTGAAGCTGAGCDDPGECGIGDVAGCRCEGIVPGYRLCQDGDFGECACPEDGQGGAGGATNGGCVPDPEWCDGLDNDCNGVVDDHFACHDDAVLDTFTKPYAGGVYLTGTGLDSANSGRALQQFWPRLSTAYLHEFDPYADKFRFRRSDGELFYSATFSGVMHATPGKDTQEPSLCGGKSGQARPGFDFSAENTLFYQCQSSLFRGNEQLIADGIDAISGVFDDGRSLVTRMLGYESFVYSVIGSDGEELNRFPPAGFYTGRLQVVPDGTSFDGDLAYTLLIRTYDQVTTELLLYAIDEQSIFRLVRRRIVPSLGFTQLALSDGTILVADAAFVRAYLPDNNERVAYRATEGIVVRPENTLSRAQLVPGPLAAEELP